MNVDEFKQKINAILQTDRQFPEDAYRFVNEAVAYTVKKKMIRGRRRHISGRELVEGAGEYAVEQFGPMAQDVLSHWGLTDGKAMGQVVFRMVEQELLVLSEEDSPADFEAEFHFEGVTSESDAATGPAKRVPPTIA
jgi:uncharacterized repeat protein (TIGR04138 family)